MARMQYDYGLNPKTTRRYLTTLEDLEMLLVNDTAGVITEWYDMDTIKKNIMIQKPEPQEEEGEGV